MYEGAYTLIQGDCIEKMRDMADASVDAVVTDPPYGLSNHKPSEVVECMTAWLAGQPYEPKGTGFMGKAWDAWVPGPEVWRECLRVLKPGGHALVFAGTRSMDLMCLALRLAGFELRDSIGYANDGNAAPLAAWVFGSGMPKAGLWTKDKAQMGDAESGAMVAAGFEGWGRGSCLKPAWEPIIVARKPLSETTVAKNMLVHRTGGINVDACRVPVDGGSRPHLLRACKPWDDAMRSVYGSGLGGSKRGESDTKLGRWPANVILDGSQEVEAAFPSAPGQMADVSSDPTSPKRANVYGAMSRAGEASANSANAGAVGFSFKLGRRREDTGSAARFFYTAKASRADRNDGCEDLPKRPLHWSSGSANPGSFQSEGTDKTAFNHHPTVKPTELMRYLCRLVTPPCGIVLDPFAGSGSTGRGAILEGFYPVLIELQPEFVEIADVRCAASALDRAKTMAQPSLFDCEVQQNATK
jgi:site-specific DNA-methyltransferase (adenine-specific)